MNKMIDISNALILMIDVQEKLVRATNAENEALNASKIIKAGNILEIPVIVTEQYPNGLGSTVENIKNNLPKDAQIFEKQSFSALDEEKILNAINETSKKQVILFGIELHICVLQTAFDLISKGYEVFIVKNASKSRHEEDFEIGINLLKSYGVKVLSLEILLFELLETSCHPHFKEIQSLIK